MPKRVFKATIIVAGTNNASKDAKIDETVSPAPIPIRELMTLSIPNLLTITIIAPVIKNVCESLPFTLIEAPIIIPNITNIK
jgi:hypothetical protein